MSNNIEGKVVVITGASSGLGEAAARLLAEQGAIVVLGARRTDRISALADEISAAGGKALAVQTDVTDVHQVGRLVDAADAMAGGGTVYFATTGTVVLASTITVSSDVSLTKRRQWSQKVPRRHRRSPRDKSAQSYSARWRADWRH